MIQVVAKQKESERLKYVCECMFERLLSTEYVLIDEEEARAVSTEFPTIWYGVDRPDLANGIVIQDSGLLWEKGWRANLEVKAEDAQYFPHLIVGKTDEWFIESEMDYNFDLLAAAFYMLTEYRKYDKSKVDEHGRWDEEKDWMIEQGYSKFPLVDIYAESLWQRMFSLWPQLYFEQKAFDYEITIDIDQPWLFKHKGIGNLLGALVKDIVAFRPALFKARLGVLLGGEDPYDTYVTLLNLAPVERLRFFFLLDTEGPFGGSHNHQNKAYRKLIKQLSDAGLATGIHFSYNCLGSESKMIAEKLALEEIIQKPVVDARMHYLRMNLPQTRRAMVAAGVENDYTTSQFAQPGYSQFTGKAMPWYDVERDEITKLKLHPTTLMDQTLRKYMKLDVGQASKKIEETMLIARKFHSDYRLLIHNSTVSDFGDWEGWKPVFS